MLANILALYAQEALQLIKPCMTANSVAWAQNCGTVFQLLFAL